MRKMSEQIEEFREAIKTADNIKILEDLHSEIVFNNINNLAFGLLEDLIFSRAENIILNGKN